MTHPMETVLETLDYQGICVEIVKWTSTKWCGFSSFAPEPGNEPETEAVTERYRNGDLYARSQILIRAGKESGMKRSAYRMPKAPPARL